MTFGKKTQFVGPKKVKSIKELEEKTPGGHLILEVQFQDFSVEHFSKPMFDAVVSETICDESQLRDRRVFPVVALLLATIRDWGIKVGELPYVSSLLSRSLQDNSDQALIELVSQWMPKPNSLDEVNYLTVDRILKSSKKTVNDVLKGS